MKYYEGKCATVLYLLILTGFLAISYFASWALLKYGLDFDLSLKFWQHRLAWAVWWSAGNILFIFFGLLITLLRRTVRDSVDYGRSAICVVRTASFIHLLLEEMSKSGGKY